MMGRADQSIKSDGKLDATHGALGTALIACEHRITNTEARV
jgi:hypothetical protein